MVRQIPNSPPLAGRCLRLLLPIFFANIGIVMAASSSVPDVCEIARLEPILQLWPPNKSFVSFEQLSNERICTTVVLRSGLSALMLLWLVVTTVLTMRHLMRLSDAKFWFICFAMSALFYCTSGIPVAARGTYYRIGLHEWWGTAYMKSGSLIIGFYAAVWFLIYLTLCTFKKLLDRK
jgi:hypothetical protein